MSGPFWTTSPFDVDKSARKKLEVIIKGQSIFWPKLEYEDKFLYCQDNRVAVYSGSPDVYEGILVSKRFYLLLILLISNSRYQINVEGGKMLLADKFRIIDDKIVVDEKVGETKSFNLPDNLAGEKIREYHKKNRRVGEHNRAPSRIEGLRLNDALEYKVASYMGVVWIIGWKVHGIRKPAGVEKPAASNDAHGDKGLGDNSKGLIVRSL